MPCPVGVSSVMGTSAEPYTYKNSFQIMIVVIKLLEHYDYPTVAEEENTIELQPYFSRRFIRFNVPPMLFS